MLCLVTCIDAKRLSTLLWVFLAALHMRRQAKDVQGLREVTVCLRRPRVVMIISLWDDESAMADFGAAVPDHASRVLRLWRGGGESWSGFFELVGPSPHSAPNSIVQSGATRAAAGGP